VKFILSIVAVLYALSPYDLLPDFIPGWGWIDDLLLLGAMWYFYYSGTARRRSAAAYRRARNTGTGAGDEKGASSENNRDIEDAWAVLGLARGATSEEIKKAYRELAGKYHPDKVAHLGDEFKVLAEERFKKVQAAYEELKDRGGV
jgi:DnaJ like chaperone protein